MFRSAMFYTVLVILVAWSQGLAVAGEPAHCEWLLRYGIYDTEEYGFDRYTTEHLRSLLRHSKAQTWQEFEQQAASVGLSIPGLPELSFGGKSVRTDFKAFREAYLSATSYDLLSDNRFRITIKKISPTLMDAVKKCLRNPPPGMLVAWLTPSKDDLTFTLTLKYNPVDDQPCKIKSLTFMSSKRGVITALNKEQAELVKRGERVPVAGVGVVFQRKIPMEGITVGINTDKGTKTLRVDPVDPNEIIGRLARQGNRTSGP